MSLSLSILALTVISLMGLIAFTITLAQQSSLSRGLENPNPLFEELRADVTQDRSVSAIMGVIRYGTPAGRVIGAGLERINDGSEAASQAMQATVFSELAPSRRAAAWLAVTVGAVGLLGFIHTALSLVWTWGRDPLPFGWSWLPAALVVVFGGLVMIWTVVSHGRLLRLRAEVFDQLEAVRQRTLHLIEGSAPHEVPVTNRQLARRG